MMNTVEICDTIYGTACNLENEQVVLAVLSDILCDKIKTTDDAIVFASQHGMLRGLINILIDYNFKNLNDLEKLQNDILNDRAKESSIAEG